MTTKNTREALVGNANQHPHYGFPLDFIINSIEANPIALLDAMVKDGMLATAGYGGISPLYYVRAPHVHEWVARSFRNGAEINVWCVCGQHNIVSSTLPIEIPGDK